jgi:hypothetical protein
MKRVFSSSCSHWVVSGANFMMMDTHTNTHEVTQKEEKPVSDYRCLYFVMMMGRGSGRLVEALREREK